MGKIIAVWSNTKKTGKSVFTYLLANKLGDLYGNDLKILVCCLNQKTSSLYRLFDVNPISVGIEDLINHSIYKSENAKVITDIIPKSQGIYYLGSIRMTNSFIHKNIDKFDVLFDELKLNFDIIIVDTISSDETMLSKLILAKADMVGIMLIQDIECLQSTDCYINQKSLYIVNQYRDIYPTAGEIRRKYALKQVLSLDYCNTLQELKNRDNLNLYYQHKTNFNTALEELCCMLELELGLVQKHPQRNTSRYFKMGMVGWKKGGVKGVLQLLRNS